MSVEFVLGRARSGKTSYCYNQIDKALEKGTYDNLIVLVPEQFNLQTQKELCERFYPGLLTVEVLSFTNLAKNVLREVGHYEMQTVDDLERIMIIKKLLQEHKKELKYFKKSVTTDGFLEGINGFITLCEQSNIEVDTLETIIGAESVTTLFKYKLEDIKNIYGWFQSYIANQFVTVEQTMGMLAKHMPESKVMEDAIIWVDGFYEFSAIQLNVVMALIKRVKRVIITVPADKKYDLYEKIAHNHPFYQGIRTYQQLGKLCEENGIKIRESKFSPSLQEENALAYLEANYLKNYPKAYAQEDESIILQTYANKEDEIDGLLKQITRLVREEGYRYKDIAILVGDLGGYKSSLESALKEYQVPYFLDMKRSMHTNSLVAMLQSVFEVIVSNWSYRSIMALLRTYMLPLELEAIDILENTLLEYGIRGKKRWEEVWDFKNKDEDFNLKINQIRQRVVAPILALEQGVLEKKNKQGHIKIKDLTVLLYFFMERIDAEGTIKKRVMQYQVELERELELENAQIWDDTIEVLERLVAILGDAEVTLTDYKNILRSSFSHMEMGIIPPTQDQIIVGTIKRTRLPKLRAVFVLGMNEGLIPPIEQEMEIFSDMDRVTLSELKDSKEEGIDRLKDAIVSEALYGGMFLVYIALTRAEEKLWVSCILADENGKNMRPSGAYYKLKKMFKEETVKVKLPLEEIQAPVPAFGYIGRLIREDLEGHVNETLWKDALSWYFENEAWAGQIKQLVSQLTFTNQQHYLEEATTNNLYDTVLETSISRLETFRNCPCCYFIQYGIKAQERKMLTWNTQELGTLFHAVLEQYPKELAKKQLTWKETYQDNMNECVKLAVNEVIKTTKNAEKVDGKLKYTAYKLYTMSRRAIRALTYQIQNGEFEPREYEVSFGMGALPAIEIQLDEQRTIRLNGQIDRVDVYMKQGEDTYVKIIDYKSGKKNFELLEVYYGLQLQLLLYLDAYLKFNKAAVPAGVFYFHIDTPYIQYKLGMNDADIESSHMKNFKLSGLVLDEPDMIQLMDKEGKGDIIPASLKKDGTFAKSSSVASREQFDGIRHHITETIRELSGEILKGKVSATPYKLGDKDPCTYCKYKGICQFDESKADNQYERLEKLDKEQIWECICKREEGK